MEIDKKTTLLIWYTAVSMFSFTKLPWITYSFFTLAGRKTGLSKYWSEQQQKQQDVQQEQTNDKNLKTQSTPWQQFSSISRIISRASLLLLFINALQSNNNDYIDSALNIFSEDEKNPVFNQNFPIYNRSNSILRPPVNGNFLYKYVDTSSLPNMLSTRVNTGFGQLYLPIILTLQPYTLIEGALSLLALAIAAHQTLCEKPSQSAMLCVKTMHSRDAWRT